MFYTFKVKNHNIQKVKIDLDIKDHYAFGCNLPFEIKKKVLQYFEQYSYPLPYKLFEFKLEEDLNEIDEFVFITLIMLYESFLLKLNLNIYIYGSEKLALGIFAASIISNDGVLVTSKRYIQEAGIVPREHLYYLNFAQITLYSDFVPMFKMEDFNHSILISRSMLVALVGGHSFYFPDIEYLKENLQTILNSIFFNISFEQMMLWTFDQSLVRNLDALITEYNIYFDNDEAINHSFLISDKLTTKKKVIFISTDILNDVTLYVSNKDLVSISLADLYKVFQRQKVRYNGYEISSNENINMEYISYSEIGFSDKEIALLNSLCKRFKLNEKKYFNILKVARTIADLSVSNFVLKDHILQACALCVLNYSH